jgi:acyl-CoA synthetase (NDP forming)
MNSTPHPLDKILAPESVVFLGASRNINTMGTFQLLQLLKGGYKGRVYPVHPTETELFGLKVYKCVTDVPEVADTAVMVLPTKIVPDILEECGKKGIKHASIISGGFDEVGEAGQELQERICAVAKKYGIVFNGPNCIGVINTHGNYNITWFSYPGKPGPVGLASQSGSYTCHTLNHITNLGSGLSKAVSLGNEAVLDIVDCLDYFENDPHTKSIALYIEGIRRGREFVRTARRVSAKKPITALYVGGTEAGARSGASHTAVLAGDDAVYDGILRQAGVIRAQTMEQLLDWSWVLAMQPPMRGDNTAVVGNSGGPGTSMADAAERLGLKVPPFPADLQAKIMKHLPNTGSAANPVDLTFTMNMALLFFDTLPNLLLNRDFVHGMLVYGVFDTEEFIRIAETVEGLDTAPMKAAEQMGEVFTEQFSKMPHKYGKPILGASFFTRNEYGSIRRLQDLGIPFLPSPERAAAALRALRERAKILDRLEQE